MNSMTRAARSLPSAVRLTGKEAVEFAVRRLRLDGVDSGSGGWGKSEFRCDPIYKRASTTFFTKQNFVEIIHLRIF